MGVYSNLISVTTFFKSNLSGIKIDGAAEFSYLKSNIWEFFNSFFSANNDTAVLNKSGVFVIDLFSVWSVIFDFILVKYGQVFDEFINNVFYDDKCLGNGPTPSCSLKYKLSDSVVYCLTL